MSILMYLLFASVFYFTVAQPPPIAIDPPKPTDPDTKKLLDEFVKELKNAIDKLLDPLMRGIDEEDCIYMKNIAMNGCISYLNAMMYGMENDPDEDEIDIYLAMDSLTPMYGIPKIESNAGN